MLRYLQLTSKIQSFALKYLTPKSIIVTFFCLYVVFLLLDPSNSIFVNNNHMNDNNDNDQIQNHPSSLFIQSKTEPRQSLVSSQQTQSFGSAQSNHNNNNNNNKNKNKIRIICISDTHNKYRLLTKQLLALFENRETDVLVHAGDMTNAGSKSELRAIRDWFHALPFKHTVIIGGNMDGIGLDSAHVDGKRIFNRNPDDGAGDSVLHYLEHESLTLRLAVNNHDENDNNNDDQDARGTVQQRELRLFGTPFTKEFVGGFQIYSDAQSQELFAQIPSGIDVLVSHGPIAGVLDATSSGQHIGDAVLAHEVLHRIRPKLMIFGHVHHSFGSHVDEQSGTRFVNCAQYNGLMSSSSGDKRMIQPIVIEL